MTTREALTLDEQALFEQEQGVVQMEAQLHEQEQELSEQEGLFAQKARAIGSHASYVAEQEQSLLRRAEAMGPEVRALAVQLLAQGEQLEPFTSELGELETRAELFAKRQELLGERLAVLDERESLYATRLRAYEQVRQLVDGLADRLISREEIISQAARQVFSAAALFISTGDGQDDATRGYGAARPRVTNPDLVAASTREPAPGDLDDAPRARIKRKRVNPRVSGRDGGFKMLLEAPLDADEGHHFFRYEDDTESDLPGIFVATPHLLKVGRDARVQLSRNGQELELVGVVAWRRAKGDPDGPPGMGIEFINPDAAGRDLVTAWSSDGELVTI